MIPFVFDIFGIAVVYALLLMTYTSFSARRSAAFGYRLIAAFLSYLLLLLLIDYGVNIVRITAGFFTRPAFDSFVAWTGILMLTGLLVRGYLHRSEKLNIDEMVNFIRASLRFDNYFRLRDVDTQEAIGKHKLRTTYEEVHGKPFDESLIATPFDELPTVFKRVGTEPAQPRRYRPAGFTEHIAALRSGRVPELNESFTFEMRKNETHPFLPMMSRFLLDPSTGTLSFTIRLPLEFVYSAERKAERTRLIEQIYISLHHVLSLEWMPLYLPYFGRMTANCTKQEMSDDAVEYERPVLTFSIAVKEMQVRAARITTISEIERIAAITDER